MCVVSVWASRRMIFSGGTAIFHLPTLFALLTRPGVSPQRRMLSIGDYQRLSYSSLLSSRFLITGQHHVATVFAAKYPTKPHPFETTKPHPFETTDHPTECPDFYAVKRADSPWRLDSTGAT